MARLVRHSSELRLTCSGYDERPQFTSMSTESDRPRRWPAFALAALLLTYAAGKAVLASQGKLGLPGGPAIAVAEHERYASQVMDVATAQWLAAATGVVGALISVATVTSPGRRMPRSAMLVLLAGLTLGVGAGAVVMAVDGFGGPGPGWSRLYGVVGLVTLGLLLATVRSYLRARPALRA